MTDVPKVFISYSHDSEEHKDWVKELAEFLRSHEIDVILDQWDLGLGSDIALFIEQGLSQSDRVLVISTDTYIEKANSGKGGAGHEKTILTADLLNDQNSNKIIPIVRNVKGETLVPEFLKSRKYLILSDDIDTEDKRLELVKDITAQHSNRTDSSNQDSSNEAKQPPGNIIVNQDLPSLEVNSTTFFSMRFAAAFPGLRGLEWFDDQENIEMRLIKLLEDPLVFSNNTPIWWWRDGNLHISSFKKLNDGIYLLNSDELKIRKIAAVNTGAYYQQFVYVETDAMEPTGIYPISEESIQENIRHFGYAREEYGLYKNETMVTLACYDDGAALINGELVELGTDVEPRTRYVTPYNIIIASSSSPINNGSFDTIFKQIMNDLLTGEATIEKLTEKILKQPRNQQL